MGLDPTNLSSISALLHRFATTNSPRVLLALRPQDLLPDWITHVIILGPNLRILRQGRKDHIKDDLIKENSITSKIETFPEPAISTVPDDESAGKSNLPNASSLNDILHAGISRDGFPLVDKQPQHPTDENEPLIEMEKVHINYGHKQVLGGWKEKVNGVEREGLWWTIRRGERWGVFGANGNPHIHPLGSWERPNAKKNRLRKNHTIISDQF